MQDTSLEIVGIGYARVWNVQTHCARNLKFQQRRAANRAAVRMVCINRQAWPDLEQMVGSRADWIGSAFLNPLLKTSATPSNPWRSDLLIPQRDANHTIRNQPPASCKPLFVHNKARSRPAFLMGIASDGALTAGGGPYVTLSWTASTQARYGTVERASCHAARASKPMFARTSASFIAQSRLRTRRATSMHPAGVRAPPINLSFRGHHCEGRGEARGWDGEAVAASRVRAASSAASGSSAQVAGESFEE